MNKMFIIGNLTRDPEIKETPNGVSVCSFSVAVNALSSNEENAVDFFPVKVWRGLGESCARYLRKGSKVAVVGTLRTRTWEDSQGIKKFGIELIASDVQFLSSSRGINEDEPPASKPVKEDKKPARKALPDLDDDSDIPF